VKVCPIYIHVYTSPLGEVCPTYTIYTYTYTCIYIHIQTYLLKQEVEGLPALHLLVERSRAVEGGWVRTRSKRDKGREFSLYGQKVIPIPIDRFQYIYIFM
jgi:hypothetical protein